MIHRTAVFCVLTFISGCAPLQGSFEKPEVHLVNVVPTNATLFETQLIFNVRIDNGNPQPLTISGGSHRFYLNDIYIGKGFSQDKITIEPFSTATYDVPINISNMRLLTEINTLLQQQRLDYKIESKLNIPDRLLFGNVTVTTEGKLLPQTPQVNKSAV